MAELPQVEGQKSRQIAAKQAKRVCKEDGKLFEEWCESKECPVGYDTAGRLMSVYRELGDKNRSAAVLSTGLTVLAAVTQTRDEDIRQALLEHIEQEAESGQDRLQRRHGPARVALGHRTARPLPRHGGRLAGHAGRVFTRKRFLTGSACRGKLFIDE